VIPILGVLDSADRETNLRAMNTAPAAKQAKYLEDASANALRLLRALGEESKQGTSRLGLPTIPRSCSVLANGIRVCDCSHLARRAFLVSESKIAKDQTGRVGEGNVHQPELSS
jgi:hypothetical protein